MHILGTENLFAQNFEKPQRTFFTRKLFRKFTKEYSFRES